MSNIFEVRIVSIKNMSEQQKTEVIKMVEQQNPEFQKNFMGFAKVTYKNASPKKIVSVEPIIGTIIQYFEKVNMEGVTIPEF